MAEVIRSVGIDLGTTNSEIYTYVNNHSRPIAAPNGSTITESKIGVDTKSVDVPIILTGAKMRNLRNRAPENVIYEPKRIIGRMFNDQYVKRDLHYWPFCIEEDSEGYPVYKFIGKDKFTGKDKFLYMSAIQVDAEILKLLKSYVPGGVSKAVITVPSYFTREQTEATKKAGELAGFEVLRCLPEPVAAAIAYGHASGATNETVVVYDLGGGTFDCCIVVIENGRYSILHSDGHSHLGGADFDNAIVRLMAAELKEKGVDVYESRKDLSKLKDLAEKAKIALSDADSYNLKHMIVNPITMEKVEYEHMLTRVEFESLIKDYIDNTIKYIRRALESSGLKPQNISRVIPIGGSTRIPYVKQRLEEFFERKIESPVNIDEGVAEGAAIDADALCNGVNLLQGVRTANLHKAVGDVQLAELSCCPHDIFFNLGDGFNRTFVEGTQWGTLRDGTTGIRVNRRISLERNFVKKVRLSVYMRRSENGAMELMHCVNIDIDEPRPGRECAIGITMIYSSRGELTVIVTDMDSGVKESSTFICRGDDSDYNSELIKLRTLRDMEEKAKRMMRELVTKGNDEKYVELRRDVMEKMAWLEDCAEYCDDDELDEQKEAFARLDESL